MVKGSVWPVGGPVFSLESSISFGRPSWQDPSSPSQPSWLPGGLLSLCQPPASSHGLTTRGHPGTGWSVAAGRGGGWRQGGGKGFRQLHFQSCYSAAQRATVWAQRDPGGRPPKVLGHRARFHHIGPPGQVNIRGGTVPAVSADRLLTPPDKLSGILTLIQ